MLNQNPEQRVDVPYAQVIDKNTGKVYGREGDTAYMVDGQVILGRAFPIDGTVICSGEKGSVQFINTHLKEERGISRRLGSLARLVLKSLC